jgi:hypothetical protein
VGEVHYIKEEFEEIAKEQDQLLYLKDMLVMASIFSVALWLTNKIIGGVNEKGVDGNTRK